MANTIINIEKFRDNWVAECEIGSFRVQRRKITSDDLDDLLAKISAAVKEADALADRRAEAPAATQTTSEAKPKAKPKAA